MTLAQLPSRTPHTTNGKGRSASSDALCLSDSPYPTAFPCDRQQPRTNATARCRMRHCAFVTQSMYRRREPCEEEPAISGKRYGRISLPQTPSSALRARKQGQRRRGE